MFVPELFKYGFKLMWRFGSLNGVQGAVRKQCSIEGKQYVLGKGFLHGRACVGCGWSRKKEGRRKCN